MTMRHVAVAAVVAYTKPRFQLVMHRFGFSTSRGSLISWTSIYDYYGRDDDSTYYCDDVGNVYCDDCSLDNSKDDEGVHDVDADVYQPWWLPMCVSATQCTYRQAVHAIYMYMNI